LIKNKTEKTFEDKISKLSRKTQESIKATNRSFDRFCKEYYCGLKKLSRQQTDHLTGFVKNTIVERHLRKFLKN
jgi:hypothetical protein